MLLLLEAKGPRWDVLKAAERPGSRDASIVAQSTQANDLVGLLARHRAVRTAFFNGTTARSLRERYVRHTLPARSVNLDNLDRLLQPTIKSV
jgi:G:T/U-mismatch repair DNA glycosylase